MTAKTTKKSQNKHRHGSPIIIKKYTNRRLYNTGSSSYVTLNDIAEMVRKEQDFIVRDAKSGEDITCAILTQIILEEQSRYGQNLLPASFLKQIIRFYGEQMSVFLLPQYLDMTMESFRNNQKQWQDQMQDMFGSMFNIKNFDINKNNPWMQSAMRNFNPFMPPTPSQTETTQNNPNENNPGENNPGENNRQEIETLEKQMQELQRRLQRLQKT